MQTQAASYKRYQSIILLIEWDSSATERAMEEPQYLMIPRYSSWVAGLHTYLVLRLPMGLHRIIESK